MNATHTTTYTTAERGGIIDPYNLAYTAEQAVRLDYLLTTERGVNGLHWGNLDHIAARWGILATLRVVRWAQQHHQGTLPPAGAAITAPDTLDQIRAAVRRHGTVYRDVFGPDAARYLAMGPLCRIAHQHGLTTTQQAVSALL